MQEKSVNKLFLDTFKFLIDLYNFKIFPQFHRITRLEKLVNLIWDMRNCYWMLKDGLMRFAEFVILKDKSQNTKTRKVSRIYFYLDTFHFYSNNVGNSLFSQDSKHIRICSLVVFSTANCSGRDSLSKKDISVVSIFSLNSPLSNSQRIKIFSTP